jgi:hypothetical protein
MKPVALLKKSFLTSLIILAHTGFASATAAPFTDELGDFSKIYEKSDNWQVADGFADKTAIRRAKNTEGFITYKIEGVTDFNLELYCVPNDMVIKNDDVDVYTSKEGKTWETVFVSKGALSEVPGVSWNAWKQTNLYNYSKLPVGTKYIKFVVPPVKDATGQAMGDGDAWRSMLRKVEFFSGKERSANAAPAKLLGNRFLTFNTMIRVNRVEATRDKGISEDERAVHTPEVVKAYRETVEAGWPGGRITWSFSWMALFDESASYRQIRALVKQYHEIYGDEVTFIPGTYFANVYNSREQVNKDIHDALNRITEFMGNGYRPKSIIAGFLAADNQKYLAEKEGIHVCQGNIWSQYGVDNQSGEGSISYPYYPSTEHFVKPAQGKNDFIDCVNLDGWTVDFLEGRHVGLDSKQPGYCSRRGVGPIENLGLLGPEPGLKEMMHSTAIHFDKGYELNGFGWVTNNWEVSCLKYVGHIEYLTKWLAETKKRWPDARMITQGEFGLLWREQFKTNDRIDYKFDEVGSGIGGSDSNLNIKWYMNKDFRLALLKEVKGDDSSVKVIDFTRYDQTYLEPTAIPGDNWSILGKINQKQTRPQDAPLSPKLLDEPDKVLILKHYPELRSLLH